MQTDATNATGSGGGGAFQNNGAGNGGNGLVLVRYAF
jgi:hypothetical protein